MLTREYLTRGYEKLSTDVLFGVVDFLFGVVDFSFGVVDFSFGVVDFSFGVVDFSFGGVFFNALLEDGMGKMLEVSLFLNCLKKFSGKTNFFSFIVVSLKS
ncbi:MAG: hypothetical protein LBF09_00555 [Odoribacteraceae bacterium]|nr:hypothetical protein [Odoribacteraceae bacterium]